MLSDIADKFLAEAFAHIEATWLSLVGLKPMHRFVEYGPEDDWWIVKYGKA